MLAVVVRVAFAVVLVFASGLWAGCQPTVSIGRVDPVLTTTASAPSTEGEPSGTTSGSEATASMSSSATATDSSSRGDSGVDSSAQTCTANIGETPCAECLGDLCCPELNACIGHPACPCFLDCYVLMLDTNSCSQACQLPASDLPPLLNDVVSCSAAMCPLECFQD